MKGMVGRWGRMITSACVVVYNFGTTITYLIVIGNQFDATFHSIYGEDFSMNVREKYKLKKEIDKMTKDLPVLKSFVLNGGDILSSHVQISRTICRRAERKLTFVKEKYNIKPIWIVYLNRLSDFLFVLGRFFLQKIP